MNGDNQKREQPQRYAENPLDDVDGFLRQACGMRDSDLFKPTQTTYRKHRFLPLTREKSMGI